MYRTKARTARAVLLVTVLTLTTLAPVTPAGATGARTVRVSVSSTGAEANGQSERPAISANGRHVVFMSHASNLVPGDTNGTTDVFLHDLLRRTTTRVSVASDGAQADGGSAIDPQISADGRFVAFASEATNLVRGDTNGKIDVFVRDLWTKRTTRVSVASRGVQSTGDSMKPTLSADGRYVAFTSVAALHPADTNGTWDTYLHDRRTGRTELLSVNSAGAVTDEMSDGPTISADGRYAVFISLATNLAPGDTNGYGDVFLRDRRKGTTVRISEGPNGEQGDDLSVGGTITADNRYVALATHATTLLPELPDTHDSHVLLYDRYRDRLEVVDIGIDGQVTNGGGFWTAINARGTHMAFTSAGTTLVAGDTNGKRDIFQRDLRRDRTVRLSVAGDGSQANDASFYPSSSADARRVAFMSYASNLVEGDTNGVPDAFVRITR